MLKMGGLGLASIGMVSCAGLSLRLRQAIFVESAAQARRCRMGADHQDDGWPQTLSSIRVSTEA